MQKIFNKLISYKKVNKKHGFTIVELLVIIIVIGILASILYLSYSGIQLRAIAASLQSDLRNAHTILEMDKLNNPDGRYPATLDDANSGRGIESSPGNVFDYTYDSGSNTYNLINTNNDLAYEISSSNGTPTLVASGGGGSATQWKQIVGGNNHTCALTLTGGHVYCWGYGYHGEFGNNTTSYSYTPVAVDTTGVLSGKTVTQITAGYYHTCAVTSDGGVYCWGYNSNGQLGNSSTTQSLVPVAVNSAGVLLGKTVTQVDAGMYFTCARTSDGQAYCWGANSNGQLGNNSTTQSTVPVAVNTTGELSGKTVAYIDAGWYHTCAITSDAQAYCWGYNSDGELGNNSTTQSNVPVAIYTAGVLSGKTIIDISAGGYHTCAVSSDGGAYCWGYNYDGEIGDNSTNDSSIPVAVNTDGVLSGKVLAKISAGSSYVCAVASSGQTYCWGDNGSGQFGDGSNTNSLVPVAVDATGGLAGKVVEQVATGGSHTCTIDSEDHAYCWGYNFYGQLGSLYVLGYIAVPIAVYNSGVLVDKDVDQISAGEEHNCSIASDGKVYCWGRNNYGQLGNNTTIDSAFPVAVDTTGVLAGKTITQVASGYRHSCAATSDGGVYCWGYNYRGQLGNSSTTNSSVPVAVDMSGVLVGKTVVGVDAGYYHSCAVTSDGLAYCWGYNSNGQLGNTSTAQSTVPVAVTTSGALSGKTVTQISVGYYHSCVVTLDNLAFCWGINTYGRLGDNSTTQRTSPVAVYTSGALSGKSVTQIEAGAVFTCAVASGQAYCWGYNSHGQLGNNSTAQSIFPVTVDVSGVLSGKTVARISAGGYHSCASTSDGGVYCWGYNLDRQLGNGLTSDSLVPSAVDMTGVLSGKFVSDVSAGYFHTSVMTSDGGSYSWGANTSGQLGDGSIFDSWTPVLVP